MNTKIKEVVQKLKVLVSGKNFTLVASFLGLYLIATGVSVVVFSYLIEKPVNTDFAGSGIDASRSKIGADIPRTEECPINGGMFTKIEKDIWEARRPITAIIENHADSRPPSGLSKADVVYEAVAEGGITRFLGVFYCGAAASDVNIAPVRSARVYFIDFAAEYADYPIFMHVGGANNYSGSGDTVKNVRALELLETLGWRTPKGNDFDTTYDSGFPVFWRNYERLGKSVATEHTMMASLDAAYSEAEKRGFGAKLEDGTSWDENFTSWKFAEDKASESPEASEISFSFWDNKPEYDVVWKYDSANNKYLRFNGGSEHVDLETKEQLSTKNLVIFFAKEQGPVDRNYHMFYTTTGTGDAIVFQNGKVIEGTWKKATRTTRGKFFDEKGSEIELVRGTTWVEVVPAGNTVNY